MQTIPLLKQREIEAQMAVALIDRYARVLGRPQAIALARESIQSLAERAGRQIADQQGRNSLEELARVVQEVWAREEALQITLHSITHDRLAFDVHRCRYAELYETLGIRNMGVHLSCCRDAAFARGFNASIQMDRTQTIMEGAAFCDFRFVLPSSP
jgi:hypothetical protein